MDITKLNELLVAGAGNIITGHDEDGVPLIVVPNDFRLGSLEEYLKEPKRIRASRQLHSVEAFADYVNRFKGDSTTVFSNLKDSKLRAHLDYHDSDQPSHDTHSASYACEFTPEWLAWIRNDKEGMNQVRFAEFLEDHIDDISEPVGAHLLEMVTNMQVIRKADFGSAVRLATGEFQFRYSEENQGGGTVQIPERITLGIAPFRNFDAYKVDARIRYTLKEGALTLRYELIEPHKVVEDAFEGITKKAESLIEGVHFYAGM